MRFPAISSFVLLSISDLRTALADESTPSMTTTEEDMTTTTTEELPTALDGASEASILVAAVITAVTVAMVNN